MSYTTTTNKGLEKVDPGTEVGTWGPYINTDWDIVDKALGGSVSYTLTTSDQNVSSTDAQALRIILTGNTGTTTFTGTGSVLGTVLTITAVSSGSLAAGTFVSGTGIPVGTQITVQLSGTIGGIGTYTINNSLTASSTAITGSTSSLNLIYPSGIGGMWIIANNTTGPAVIYAKTSAVGSSGVYLTQQSTSLVFSDGTNVGYADSRFSNSAIGATGGGSDAIFFLNDLYVTADYTIPSNKNAMTAGPITVNSGVTVTINAPTVWTIV
jgi:hypothetical protein